MNEHFWWYLARSSGLVAWSMLTATVIWGILLSTKVLPTQRRPLWLQAVHRWLAGLTVSFLAVHLASLLLDSYVEFDVADIVIPFRTDWKPAAVALGILAMWLLVAVELTSIAMRRLSRRVWRGVHLGSYLVFWSTSLHAAFAGSDVTSPVYRVTAVASVAAVAWALMYRIATRRAVRRAERRAAVPGRSAGPGEDRSVHDPRPAHHGAAERTLEVTT